MSQDECSTEARMYTRRKPKEGTTRSGATAPTERNCADKAPVRQQSATHKGSKTKSPFCVVLKTYHLDTWILHKTCLKHFNFLNRKFCAQSFLHGTSWQQQWDRELKKTQEVETRFKTRQLQLHGTPAHCSTPSETTMTATPTSSPATGTAVMNRNRSTTSSHQTSVCVRGPSTQPPRLRITGV